MIWLRYTLTPQGNVSAGRSRETGNTRSAYEVLPGSVVRGALAAIWWLDGAGNQSAFDDLFGSTLTVHTAIPSVAGVAAEMNPCGWSRAKYPVDAPYASSGTVTTEGRVVGRGWAVPRSWMTNATRAGLTGGVAEDGVLFTRNASHPSVSYSGYLALEDRTPGEDVEWLKRDRGVSIGGQLSIMGRCIWRCEESDDPFPAPTLETVALTALQPLILIDHYGVNSLDLSCAIQDAVRLAGADVEVIDTATRPVAIGGWHGRAGFPKPMEWALDSGAWALLRSAQPAEAWGALRRGLGVRRLEGYGTIALTDADERPRATGATPPPQSFDAGAPEAARHEPTPEPQDHDEQIRELVRRIPDEERPSAVRHLLKLARELDALEHRPMRGPLVAGRITSAKNERWCRTISEDVVQALLDGLRTKASRKVTVSELEDMR